VWAFIGLSSSSVGGPVCSCTLSGTLDVCMQQTASEYEGEVTVCDTTKIRVGLLGENSGCFGGMQRTQRCSLNAALAVFCLLKCRIKTCHVQCDHCRLEQAWREMKMMMMIADDGWRWLTSCGRPPRRWSDELVDWWLLTNGGRDVTHDWWNKITAKHWWLRLKKLIPETVVH